MVIVIENGPDGSSSKPDEAVRISLSANNLRLWEISWQTGLFKQAFLEKENSEFKLVN